TYTIEGVDAAIVKADETHMNSIFSNLIFNAKDALEEQEVDRPKEINVAVDRMDDKNDNFFLIKVSDNGPGITEENLKQIFEPFFSTKPTSGTGLGLGIVKRLVKLYGGKIEATSEEGKRTAFTITLKRV
ncbi:MAG: HAMP domain-containing histidine kinase, partial [Deltaproteobacteria bacterium]|nr:HAMP domain-containing histidine kinase [Deltaproteobacteria bacterium]